MQYKPLYIVLLVTCVLSPSLLAGTVSTSVVDVTGYGLTRNEAIASGLVEAVRQVEGASVEASRSITRRLTQVLQKRKEQNVSVTDFVEKITSLSSGLVRTYSIEDDKHTKRGWNVDLKVTVLKFVPGESGRGGKATFAVLPLRLAHEGFQIANDSVAGAEISRRIEQGVVTHLTQSRRFAVLDRTYIEEVLGEQKLLKATNAPLEEQAKISQLLGADYLLVGTLDNLSVEHRSGVVKLTGYRYHEYTGRADLHFRVVDAATAKVHWAGRVRVTVPNRVYEQLAEADEALEVDEPLIEQTSDQVATRVIDAIHPIKVAKVRDDGIVILNQGGSRVAVGDRLDVFTWGEIIRDPDTGKPLTPDEQLLGTIEVTRVTSKVSYATVVQGKPSTFEVRSICRRAER